MARRTRFFGSKCLGTDVYIYKIDGIVSILNQWQESDIAKKMNFVEIFHFSAIVAVFDPRIKLELVEHSKKFYGDKISDYVQPNDSVDYIFNEYAKCLGNQGLSSSSDGDDPSKTPELQKYLQEPLQPDEEFDTLGWWHTKSQDYPTLWMMVRDILAIPISTSSSISAFYIETMTLDPIFNDLDPDIIEAFFCGKDWLDNPIMITPNKDNQHSTANPEPMLEISGSTSGLVPLPTADASHVWSGILAPQEKHDPSNADTELMPATTCPKPLPLPTKNDRISALCVTPSGPDVDLSSGKGSEEVLEDSDDEPTMQKRIFDSDKEEGDEHETEAMQIPEEPEIAADREMSTAPIPTTPVALVSTTPTNPIPMGPDMSSFFYLLPYLRYKFVLFISFIHSLYRISYLPSGPILTAPSQFEVSSSFATVLDPVSEVGACFPCSDQSVLNDLYSEIVADHAMLTAPIFATPVALVSTTLTTLIPMGPGPILTAPSQFEVGSSFATVLDPVSEVLSYFDEPVVNNPKIADIATPTTSIPATPVALVSTTPTTPIPMGPGPIPTAPSQFEVGKEEV